MRMPSTAVLFCSDILLLCLLLSPSCAPRQGQVTPDVDAPSDSPFGKPVSSSGRLEENVEPRETGAVIVDILTLQPNHLYPQKSQPLQSSPLRRLPPGAITPRGWVATRLELQMPSLREALAKGSPYAVRAAVTTLHVAGDDGLRRTVDEILGAIVDSQDGDGRSEDPGQKDDTLDSWPGTVLLDTLARYYALSGDADVLGLMKRCLTVEQSRSSTREATEIDGLMLPFSPADGVANLIERLLPVAATGDACQRADYLEKVVFNALPASFPGDLADVVATGTPNLAAHTESGDVPEHRLDLLRAWPLYASSLWVASPGDGLAAISHAPCEISAMVGEDEGTAITLRVETTYPFEEEVRITVNTPRPSSFPLALRIPAWCEGAVAVINDGAPLRGCAGTFLGLSRTWEDGDTVILRLPMRVALSGAERNSVSVSLGPLVFSLKLDVEEHRDDRGNLEFRTSTAWNRVLVLDRIRPDQSIAVHRHEDSLDPFAAVVLRAHGRTLPGWSSDPLDLPRSPVLETRLSGEPQPLTLIPCGTARLRIALLPWTSH